MPAGTADGEVAEGTGTGVRTAGRVAGWVAGWVAGTGRLAGWSGTGWPPATPDRMPPSKRAMAWLGVPVAALLAGGTGLALASEGGGHPARTGLDSAVSRSTPAPGSATPSPVPSRTSAPSPVPWPTRARTPVPVPSGSARPRPVPSPTSTAIPISG